MIEFLFRAFKEPIAITLMKCALERNKLKKE